MLGMGLLLVQEGVVRCLMGGLSSILHRKTTLLVVVLFCTSFARIEASL